MVGDPVLLEVVCADLLTAPAAADLRFALDGHRRLLLVLGELQQAGAQHQHRPGPVLQLAALVLHGNDQSRRLVSDAHGGVGGVDALAARAT